MNFDSMRYCIAHIADWVQRIIEANPLRRRRRSASMYLSDLDLPNEFIYEEMDLAPEETFNLAANLEHVYDFCQQDGTKVSLKNSR